MKVSSTISRPSRYVISLDLALIMLLYLFAWKYLLFGIKEGNKGSLDSRSAGLRRDNVKS
jgi:hypothetical protein